MLSKKQAKIFFLGGIILFTVIFLGLTYDTLKNGIPQHTDVEALKGDVLVGRELWDANNCMGCHTIMGEGAYYAPELTKVIDRRGPDYVKALLMSEAPWAPNGRKMVAYGFSEEEANGLVAFLGWVGKSDLNGFPPVPELTRK